jgi:hypothetical protein
MIAEIKDTAFPRVVYNSSDTLDDKRAYMCSACGAVIEEVDQPVCLKCHKEIRWPSWVTKVNRLCDKSRLTKEQLAQDPDFVNSLDIKVSHEALSIIKDLGAQEGCMNKYDKKFKTKFIEDNTTIKVLDYNVVKDKEALCFLQTSSSRYYYKLEGTSTYKYKEIFKELGGFYKHEEKFWILSDIMVDKFFNILYCLTNDVDLKKD